ncbi:HNH endonuclease [Streptomyces microflavus]|uniref:HNH endonuclease n=1 Tax=Streptomyces microflavus TaxID=1919 RepID=UPI0036553372
MLSPRAKQCGQPDCRRRFNADRMREWNRAYRKEHGAWYSRKNFGDQQRQQDRVRRAGGEHWRRLYPAAAAAADAKRRALVQQARTDEVFTPSEVHTRDGWTCQLCRLPIDPDVAWPHPESPSVDHVIPLSRGGTHALSNVQSAHLGCNSSKGDKLISEVAEALRSQAQTQ